MRNIHKPIYSIIIFLTVVMAISSCGQSYEESKRISRQERLRLQREDSLALKIGVLPTLDCLPIFVAKERQLYDTAFDIRLKQFKSQMDCDEALIKGRLEGNVTDIVRAVRLRNKGVAIDLFSSTNAQWQLISGYRARIKELKYLNDKMVAITRYSATALLADYAVDSCKLKQEDVFRVQINDVNLRLKMLLNNEMDAVLLPEPQATVARMANNVVLMDTRSKDMRFGLITMRSKALKEKRRKQQIDAFVKGYNAACDSINKYGLRNYSAVIEKYCGVQAKVVSALPKVKYNHIEKPRQKDIDRAAKWLK